MARHALHSMPLVEVMLFTTSDPRTSTLEITGRALHTATGDDVLSIPEKNVDTVDSMRCP